MVNILLEGFDVDAPWLMPELKRYLRPGSKVVVVAFSFRDAQAVDTAGWNRLYARGEGKYYGGIVSSLAAYGISEADVSFVNYFEDSHETAAQKIENADVIYFPGGLPDRMMERICEFGLEDVLMQHKGVVMGFSAGAVVQLKEYHLSPDEDYPEFGYYNGLPWLDGFFLEVHYEGNKEQNAAIQRVLVERKCTVYATEFMKGAVISDNGQIKLVGNVHEFKP